MTKKELENWLLGNEFFKSSKMENTYQKMTNHIIIAVQLNWNNVRVLQLDVRPSSHAGLSEQVFPYRGCTVDYGWKDDSTYSRVYLGKNFEIKGRG